MVKATVLIPNYNNAEYIEECLKSIKNQTYSDFNILIVDDGSTDNSVELINNFPDERIRLIEKEVNSGIVDTLNKGLENINSEYIIRMDGDDLMKINRIEVLVNFMENNHQYGVCSSSIQHFGLSDQILTYEKDQLQNRANLIFSHTIGHACSIFRMSLFNENHISYSNGYKLMEDYKLFYDISKKSKLTSIPEILYLYRQEEYNQSNRLSLIRKPGYIKIYSEILQELEFSDYLKSANIHYEMHKNVPINYEMKVFKNHFKMLIHKNNKLSIFPKKEFNITINKVYNSLFFRMADQKKVKLKHAILFSIYSPKRFYYYLKALYK